MGRDGLRAVRGGSRRSQRVAPWATWSVKQWETANAEESAVASEELAAQSSTLHRAVADLLELVGGALEAQAEHTTPISSLHSSRNGDAVTRRAPAITGGVRGTKRTTSMQKQTASSLAPMRTFKEINLKVQRGEEAGITAPHER